MALLLRVGTFPCMAKGAFVWRAMQLLLALVQRGNAEMYHRSGPVNSHEWGMHLDAGFAVPLLMS